MIGGDIKNNGPCSAQDVPPNYGNLLSMDKIASGNSKKEAYDNQMTDDQILSLLFGGKAIKDLTDKEFRDFIGESIDGLDLAEMSKNGEYNRRVTKLKDTFLRTTNMQKTSYSTTARVRAVREARWARENSTARTLNSNISDFYTRIDSDWQNSETI